MTPDRTLDRARLATLMASELAAFERANPKSKALYERAHGVRGPESRGPTAQGVGRDSVGSGGRWARGVSS